MITSMNYVKNTHEIVSSVEGIRCRHKNDNFSFLTGPEQTYKKNGKCISKINKDNFFFLLKIRRKMTFFFSKERQGVSLKCVTEAKNIQEFIP